MEWAMDKDDDYVFVDVPGDSDGDYVDSERQRRLETQVRELQAAQMRWEIQRMDLEMQLMTERSDRLQHTQHLEDELHHAKQVAMHLTHERIKQAAIVADLRNQLRCRHHMLMAILRNELREKSVAFRLKRSYAQAVRCSDDPWLLELLKREVPKIESLDADTYVSL
ncbi:unnamed protein product [Aphanomyces euteiches]|uniref:Uncharacterized protein n=1 Tax=Aphanomyces euteiches TaxID=100861 RepID=A0A6G0WT26_9STRA|nr:hypothetical protein Ae201684_012011 [Aphanomyces euteiches]KAH9055956.1 hypothetical protein Ae201684P_021696 [Aphanomyces euteiches]KAH9154370.1 hypothetical protein AeRB84_003527 [Aphanomyces euteiches]